ncbi:NAD kinase [Niallia sp. Krafla_26]|uniref:NAD kinase n=1 Tax=Niallia sp. Krafla_26 TaxID=3064703 RepID=UPI003D16A2A7
MTDRKNIYFFYKESTSIHKNLDNLINRITENGFNVVNDAQDANIIASIGGDGDFLQCVRRTRFRDDCLYAGISNTNQLSFYCDFYLDNVEKMIEAIVENQMKVRRYPVIEVTINDGPSYECINEFSIQSAIVKTFILDVYINNLHLETFRGDGLIISTPTGSTAYNKSVHGAVVDPKLTCMQITELGSLNNNQYRTLGSPFIVSEDKTLTLKVAKEGNEHPIMAIDNEALSVRQVEKIQIKLTGKKIKTIKLKDNTFWHKVKRTFL